MIDMKNSSRTVIPIGRFFCDKKQPAQAARQGVVDGNQSQGYVLLESRYREALSDLEGFERIWLIYFFDHQNWKPKVLTPRGGKTKRGLFATRSPYRPNSIGLSCVRLEKIEGLKVWVSEFDLLDQTCVIDIKPYLPYADAFAQAKTGWVESETSTAYQLQIEACAREQLDFLLGNHLDLFSVLSAQLVFEPTNTKKKRVRLLDEATKAWQFAYRNWRVQFILCDHLGEPTVQVQKIVSGYTASELTPPFVDDRYQDKELHFLFTKKFHDMTVSTQA